jgi:muramoyltetrapeptide carboxypeptidase
MSDPAKSRCGWTLPHRLQPGDTVAVVAPSGPVPRPRLEKGLAELEKMGLEPRWQEEILSREGFLAGNLERRRLEWQAAWADEGNRAVLAARGGAGANQLLPLDDAPGERHPVFCGFSDITFLHAALGQRRLVSFYGPMVAWDLSRGDGKRGGYDGALFRRLLFDGEPGGLLTPGGAEAIRPGRAEGRLAGGCLSLLSATWGTPEAPDLEDAVLLLEDEKETPYRIDRYLHHLRRGGAFQSVRAILLGEFPDCAPVPERSATARTIMENFFADFPGPVLWSVPAGHTSKPNLTLPLGTWAAVDGDRVTLELLEPAVAG